MLLLLKHSKIPDCFISWNASFAKNWILNATHFNLFYSFFFFFFDSKRQRKTPTVIRHLVSSLRPDHAVAQGIRFCTLTYFLNVKLFATFILSWNSTKCILWYLLELSDPFIKNENSVLPISIEKNFQQKIYFCLLKIRTILFKEGKSNFFD